MSTTVETKQAAEPSADGSEKKKPLAPVWTATRYDRVTSLLMSLIMLCALAASSLGVIWASNKQWIVHHSPKPVQMQEVIEDVEGGGAEDGILGESLYAPGPEAPEISTATDMDDAFSDTPAIEQTMTAVLQEVGAAMEASEQLMMGSDTGSSALLGGNPKGKGRHRALGKGPGDGGGAKRHERWEITFDSGQTEDEYARQLDYFRVELGAIVDKKMYVVSNLSQRQPKVRIAAGGPDEKRLYFSWRSGGRRQIDLNLLRKAGVPLSGNVIVLQFYPSDTEQRLARLERDHLEKAKNHKIMQTVRKTKFAVVRKAGGYDFQITKQEYFGEPASN